MPKPALLAFVAAVVLVLPPSPAAAQPVTLEGFFIAERDCPATRRKEGGNPGNVKLEAMRAYRVLQRNDTPGTHYRILVPGAPAIAERWVPMDCGAYAPEESLVRAPAPGASPPAGPAHAGGAVEHVLAASWQPGFCLTRPDKPECRSQTADRFDATHFSIHGLWPDDLDDTEIFPCYCDAGEPRSCRVNMAPVSAIELSDSVRAQLDVAMPGVRSRLHLHEWSKHGSCYEDDLAGPGRGADPDEYFAETLALMEQLNASAVRELFAARIGTVLSAERIGEAFDAAFGEGAGRRVALRCEQVGGRAVITEVWINLGAGIMPDSRLPDLILAAPPAAQSSDARPCRGGLVAAVAER